MKRILSVFCLVGLFFGLVSIAGAVPYTTTLEFSGSGWYVDSQLEKTDKPSASQAKEELGPFFDSLLLSMLGQMWPLYGEIDYLIDWDLPDRHTDYYWTLDVDFWYGIAPQSGASSINKSYTNSFDLGTFALVDYKAEIIQAKSFIEGLPNPGTFGPVSYDLNGDWKKGKIYFRSEFGNATDLFRRRDRLERATNSQPRTGYHPSVRFRSPRISRL